MVVSNTVLAAYVGLFGSAVVACLGGLTRLSRIRDPDTRRGLGALLSLSAAWAAAQMGHILASEPWAVVASHTVGLVFGLAAVGAWLYFCSAYTGRSYHEKPRYRRLALAVFLLIVAFKLTNPLHELYFETTTTSVPFRHVTIQEQPAFWVIAGLAYVLSAIGFYMLVDIFEEYRSTSPGLKLVVLLAAIPVGFDVVGYLAPPPFLPLNYESIGVGLFAIGALFVVEEPFLAVPRYGRERVIDSLDDAILILDRQDRVRDYNDAAVDLFPDLATGDTPRIDDIERIDAAIAADGETVELDRDGETRYLVIRRIRVTVGATDVGYSIVCTDVTEIERQRRELRRKDDQLEGFATAISHELRNSVSIVSGQAELLSHIATERDDPEIRSRTETILDETKDMERIVDELRTLARYSQRISDTASVDLGDVARSAERRAGIDGLELRIDRSIEVDADRERLRELFRHAFVFAARNGATRVSVSGHSDGFAIEDDGRSLDGFDEADVFAYGNAVPDGDTEMLLPNVRMLAMSHGWETSLDAEHTEGVRIEVEDVDTEPSA